MAKVGVEGTDAPSTAVTKVEEKMAKTEKRCQYIYRIYLTVGSSKKTTLIQFLKTF